jgi:hypothetical protein
MSNDTIELNFKADTFEEAISQAIVAALGSEMSLGYADLFEPLCDLRPRAIHSQFARACQVDHDR